MNRSSSPSKPPRSKPIIGLLGAPGSGKSSVARHFESLGCGIIDADALAHAALDIPEVRERIVTWWGGEMLNEQGVVDRHNLAGVVFSRPEELRRLESLIHPRVAAERLRLREKYRGDDVIIAIVEDCPLLLEAGLDAEIDVLVFVDAPAEVRYARLAASRGWRPEQVAARERNQLPLDNKRARADYVVNNGASERICLTDVTRVLSLIVPPAPPGFPRTSITET